MPLAPSEALQRRLLFYIDLESLSLGERRDAISLLRERIAGAGAGASVSVVSYFGHASAHVWDERGLARIEAELDRLVAEVPEESSSSYVEARGQSGGTGAGGIVSSFEARRILETSLIRAVVEGEKMAQASGGLSRALESALRDVGLHVTGERERAREGAHALRETLEKFNGGGGKRHAVLVSGGFERLPGQSFLERLEAARRSARSFGDLSARSSSSIPGFAGMGSGLTFPLTRVTEQERLESWLATSGIVVHFVSAASLDTGHSAESLSFESNRNISAERRNFEDGPQRLIEVTGGLQRRPSSVDNVLAATTATYRLGVRLPESFGRGPFKIAVTTSRKGVSLRHQRSFQPPPPSSAPARADLAAAEEVVREARREERSESPTRLAGPALPITATFAGKLRSDGKKPGHNVYRVDVSVPHDELKFVPAEDGFLASARVSVTASGIGSTTAGDEVTLELSPGYTSEEFLSMRDRPLVKSVMLTLPPGRYRLSAAVSDLLAERAGVATLEVDAAP
jgi:hypothetical protein